MTEQNRAATPAEAVMIEDLVSCGFARDDAAASVASLSEALERAGFDLVRKSDPADDHVRERVAMAICIRMGDYSRHAYRYLGVSDAALSVLRPGDKLPGGLVVVPRRLLQQFGCECTGRCENAEWLPAGSRDCPSHQVTVMLAAAKETGR